MSTNKITTTFDGDTRKLERAILQLQSRQERFEKKTANSHRRAAEQAARSWESANQRIAAQQASIGQSLSKFAGVFAGAFGAQEAVKLADTFTQFEAKLINAKVASEEMASVQERLFAAANANGTEVVALADLYGSLAMSAKSVGLSQSEMMLATEGVAAAMRLSGSNTAQSSSTILQLGQALAGGTVRAEEYNSMLENAPALVRAVADSSDRWKGDLGKLRQEINAGKVSSEDWAKAIVAASNKLKSDAANAPLTVAASLQILENKLVQFIGKADDTLGASEKLAWAFETIGDHIDDVAAVAIVFAAALVARLIPGLVATGNAALGSSAKLLAFQISMQRSMTGASTGMAGAAIMAGNLGRGLGALSAMMGGPLGIAITALVAGIVLVKNRMDELKKRATELPASFTTTTTASVTDLNAVRTRVTTAEGTLTAQNTRLNTVESDVAGKASNSDFNTLKTEVTTARGSATSLNNRLNTTDATIAGKASAQSVTDLAGRVTSAEGTLTAQNTRLSSVETTANNAAKASDLTALTTRVTNAEGVNTAQNTRLNTVETDVAGKASTQSVTDLSSSVSVRNRTFRQNAAPTSPAGGYPLVAGDIWINTTAGQNNAQSAWTGTAWTSIADPRVASSAQGVTDINAKIGTVTGTVADALNKKAEASDLTTLSGRVGTAESTLTATNTKLNTVEATANGAAKASDLNALTNRVTSAEGVNTAQNTRLNTVESDVAGKASSTSVTNLQNEITGARNGSANLNAQLATMRQTTTDGLAGKAAASDLTNLAVRVGNTETVNTAQNTRLNTAESDIAGKASAQSVTDLSSSVAVRNRTFRQNAAPTSPAGGYPLITGDTWINTTSGQNNALSIWTGTAWTTAVDPRIAPASTGVTDLTAKIGTVSGTVADALAGKASAQSVTDLTGRITTAETDLTATKTKLSSVETTANSAAKASDLTTLQGRMTTAETDITATNTKLSTVETTANNAAKSSDVASLTSTVNTKPQTFAQATAPSSTGRITGDLWVNTSSNNQLNRWSGSAWVAVHDVRGADALAELTAARNGSANLNAQLQTMRQTTTDGLAGKASAQSVTDLTTRVTNAEGVNTAQNTRLSTAETELGKKALATDLTALQGRVTTAETDLTATNTKLNTVEATANNAAKASDLTALTTRVTNTETVNTAQNTRLNTVETDVAGKASAQSVTDLSSSVSVRNRTFRQNAAPTSPAGGYPLVAGDTWINTTAGQNNALSIWTGTAWTTAVDPRIAPASTGVTDLTAKIGTITGTVADALAGKASAQSVTDLTTRVASTESVNTTQNTRLSTVETTANNAAKASDLTALTTRVTTAEGSLTAQNTRLNTAESDIAGKATAQSVSDLNTSVLGLTTRVGATETATSNLATQKADATRVTTLEAQAKQTPGANLITKGVWTDATVGPWINATAVADDGPSGLGRKFVMRTTSTDSGHGDFQPGSWQSRKFRATGWVKIPTGTATVGIGVIGQNATGASVNSYAAVSAPNDTWTSFDLTVTAPANMVTGRPFVRSNSPFGVLWTDLRLEDITEARAVDDKLTGVTARVGTVETATSNLATQKADATRVTTLENTINAPTTGLNAKVTALQGQTTSLDTNKANASDLTALQGRVTTAETDISAQNTKLNTVETTANNAAKASDLTALTTRVTNAEGVNTAQNTRLNTVETDVAGKASAQSVSDLSSSVAVRNRTFRQNAAPTSPAGGYPLITGDTWINTTSGQNNGLSIWTGTAWTSAVDPRIAPASTGVTDLTAKIGTVSGTVADALAGKAGASDLTALTGRVTTAEGSLTAQNTRLNTVETGLNGKASSQSVTDLTSTVNTKPQTFAQATAPSSTGRITGDLWANTSANNQLNRWSGTAWVAVHDVRGADALAELTAARNGSASLNAQLQTMRQTSTDGLAGKASASDFTALTTRVTNAEGVNTAQNTRLNTVESDVAGKASSQSVTNLNSTVNGLSGRMTTVETTTANLQTNKADASRVTTLEAQAKTAGVPNGMPNPAFTAKRTETGVGEWGNPTGNAPLSNLPVGYVSGWNGLSEQLCNRGLNYSNGSLTAYGKMNVVYAITQNLADNSTQLFDIVSPDRTTKDGQPLYMIPCSPGDRVFGRFLAAGHRCEIGLLFTWFGKDASGNIVYINETFGGYVTGTNNYNGHNGDPANFVEVKATATVPSNLSIRPQWFSIIPRAQVRRDPTYAAIGMFAQPMACVVPTGVDYVPYNEGGNSSLFARVSATESATADLYGKTRARWAIGASVPGADAFIQAEAETTPGQPATSSVGIGARSISLYNPQGDDWRLAMKVEGGNAVFTGGLQAGAFIRLGNGQGWPVALRPVDFEAGDGAVVNFGTDLGGLPSLSFAMNNLAPLNAGESYDVRAENLTATGFTMRAKINVPGVTGQQSSTGSGANESIAGVAVKYFDLGAQPASTDGTYSIVASGTTTYTIPRRTEWMDFEGFGITAIYVKKNNVWSKAATVPFSWWDVAGNPGNNNINGLASWAISENVQLGSGVQSIAVGIDPSTVEGINRTSRVVSIGPVTWQAQAAGSSVRTATPNGQKTRVTVRPQ